MSILSQNIVKIGDSMKFFLVALTSLLFSSCTVTISQTATDTHGYAEDVVDETQKATNDVDADADLSIPASIL